MNPSRKPTESGNTSQVLRLSDLVTYQVGAVVSKTLLDKKAGTLTLFAFAEEQD